MSSSGNKHNILSLNTLVGFGVCGLVGSLLSLDYTSGSFGYSVGPLFCIIVLSSMVVPDAWE